MTTNPSIMLLLGMHRSGTSLLGNVIDKLGADLGISLMPAGSDNMTGFYENWRIVALHDKFMARFAMAWDRPGLLPYNWLDSEGVAADIDELGRIAESEFAFDRPIAVKDPRLAIVHPLWTALAERLESQLRHIVILRHPEEVVLSLARRNRMSLDWAGKLYCDYNLRIRDCVLGDERTFWLTYDQLVSDPATVVVRLAKFFEPELGELRPEVIAAAASEAIPSLQHHARRGSSLTPFGYAYENISSNPGEGITGPELSEFFDLLSISTPREAQTFLALEAPNSSAGRHFQVKKLISKTTTKPVPPSHDSQLIKAADEHP